MESPLTEIGKNIDKDSCKISQKKAENYMNRVYSKDNASPFYTKHNNKGKAL